MVEPTDFALIVPAHNEEAVIARCLETALRGAPEFGGPQVIIAANGCTDRTVEIARALVPDALVLDLPEGSKTKAMNAAHRKALCFPRLFLDADVRCDYPSLVALANVLRQPGVMAASPRLNMDLSRSNALIRSYYKVWMTQPYVTRAMVGSGCFGLSKDGYDRIGDFPPITGDDIWVHSRFREKERRNIGADETGQPVQFTVSPPRRAIDQIRVESRRRLGNEELLRRYPSPHYAGSNQAGDLKTALRHGASLFDVMVYLSIKALARIRGKWTKWRHRKIVWERDITAREF